MVHHGHQTAQRDIREHQLPRRKRELWRRRQPFFVRRDAHGDPWRAYVDEPHVPFEDGTELRFGGGVLVLRRDEWLKIDVVTDAFVAFASGQSLPASLRWRWVPVAE